MTHAPHTTPFALPPHVIKLAAGNFMTVRSDAAGVRAAAFFAKPTLSGSYENRRTDTYTGIYILRGSGTFHDHLGRRHRVQAGDFLQLAPVLPHSVVQDPDGQWIEAWLTLAPDFAQSLVHIGMLNLEKTVQTPGLHHHLIAEFEHMQDEMRRVDAFSGARATIAAQNLLVKMVSLAAAAAPRDSNQQMVEELCQLLSQDLDDRLDLPDLAARFPLSYERLRKVFKQRTGFSLADYRIRRRVERAQALLEHQQLPIKQVAHMLGYPDPFTFSRQFRKFTGRAPSSYLIR